MICSYKYRIYPSKSQARLLERVVEIHRQLYNAALQERRDAWRMCKKSISCHDQCSQLKELREYPDPAHSGLGGTDAAWLSYSSIQQTLRKPDKAFAAFFRRVNSSDKAGCPRFRSRPPLEFGRLRVQNAGRIQTVLHRAIPDNAKLKQVVIKRESLQH